MKSEENILENTRAVSPVHYPFTCVSALTAFSGNCGALPFCMVASAETDTSVSTSTTSIVPVHLTDNSVILPPSIVRLTVP